jgi:hypothetical protein
MYLRPLRVASLAALVSAVLVSCSGGDSGPTDPGETPSFSLTVNPTTILIDQGASGTLTVTIARAGGFSGSVQVTAEDLPPGVTAAPLSVAAGSTSGSLVLSAATDAMVGQGSFTVRGAGSGVDPATRNVTIGVNEVQVASPAFSISVNPGSLSLEPGSQGEATVVIVRSGGFSGPVSFTASELPDGLAASFAPSPAPGSFSIVTVDVGSTVSAGTYAVTLDATGSGVEPRTAELSLEVTAAPPPPPPGGNVTFQFCGTAGGLPAWVAYQDGSGPWTRVQPDGAEASFQIDSDVGGIAWVTSDATHGHSLEVIFAAREEFILWGVDRCNGRPGAGKSVSATLAGVGTGMGGGPIQFPVASLGGLTALGASPSPFLGGSLTFTGVPDGPVDLLAGRATFNIATQTITPDRMIIRRGLNPQAGGNLAAPIDFNGGDSFAPATSGLTVTGVTGGEMVVQSTLFRTTDGMGPVAFATGHSTNWYGVPSGQMQLGDLHVLGVTATGADETNPLAPSRTTLRMIATPAPVSVALGPELSDPAVMLFQSGGHRRGRATYQIQPEYDRFWVADFSQGTTVAREGQVQVTRAYHGSGTGSVNLEIPNLRSVSGWNTDWEFVSGEPVTWTVSAAGWTQPGGIMLPPLQDGAEYRTASRMGQLTLP